MKITEELKFIFGNRLKENEPMSHHTNFRIGGPAKFFVEAKSVEELKCAIEIAKKNCCTIFVFGGGSNTLVSDAGFDGLVIKMSMREISIDGQHIRAEAGVLMTMLSKTALEAGLTGLEWAISLPGTLGGAVRGNAGCFGGETKDYLVEIELLVNGKVVRYTKDQLFFGYRESKIKHSFDIVLSATFKLERGDSVLVKEKMNTILSRRKSTQPNDAGSAGCMFKNYEIKSDDELQRLMEKFDLPQEMIVNRRISVGWLIDQLDLKGKQIGDARVSEKHGNFLLNMGNATADDVVQLIAFIKTRARNTFGVQIEEEVQYVGF
ncbi:MAG: UDP-N-acetylmuramate dehydrogenase [Patescibacteria group bacterium]